MCSLIRPASVSVASRSAMPAQDLIGYRFSSVRVGMLCGICFERNRDDAVGVSDVEQEVQHIAVLDDVLLAFRAHLARFLRALFALVRDEVLIRYGLRANEAAFEVGMDHAGRLRRGVADVNGP